MLHDRSHDAVGLGRRRCGPVISTSFPWCCRPRFRQRLDLFGSQMSSLSCSRSGSHWVSSYLRPGDGDVPMLFLLGNKREHRPSAALHASRQPSGSLYLNGLAAGAFDDRRLMHQVRAMSTMAARVFADRRVTVKIVQIRSFLVSPSTFLVPAERAPVEYVRRSTPRRLEEPSPRYCSFCPWPPCESWNVIVLPRLPSILRAISKRDCRSANSIERIN